MVASNAETTKRRPPPVGWKPGQSGNPRGRPKAQFDIAAMCREHAPEAVATLVAALKRPKDAIPAAIALLDRGFGRPKQMIETNDPTSPIHLHLLAAIAVSRELLERVEQRGAPTINGDAEQPAVPANLLDAPLPLE